jgi:hypothetical protein
MVENLLELFEVDEWIIEAILGVDLSNALNSEEFETLDNTVVSRIPSFLSFTNLYTLWKSKLNTQHSTLNTQHSTLNTQHSTLNTQHSTLNTQHSAGAREMPPKLQLHEITTSCLFLSMI